MVDVAMILERLKRLSGYLEFLDRQSSLTLEEFVKDRMTQSAVERVLQLAIQSVVNISTHILATASNLTPQDYSDALVKLARAGVIPKAFADKIAALPKFRNVLVHAYVDIDPRLVYENMQEHLNDFVLFADYITKWLDQQGLLTPPDEQS